MSGMFRDLQARQPLLATLGWLMLATLLASLVGIWLDPRSINGVSVWVKPAKFAASFLVWLWTLAFAFGLLTAPRGILGGIVAWGSAAAGLFEVGWITLRAAQGLPSHFATDPLGGPMYGLMGLAALSLVALAALLGALILARPTPGAERRWVLAVGLGLVIGGVASGITGASISVLGGPVIAGTPGDGNAFPPFFWSRDGGDLRIAHFIGTHAMQALPALVLAGGGVALVWAGALGIVGLTAAAYWAAMAGIALSF
jgi:hypothetical protein